MTERLSDWDARFSAFIAANARRAHAYGEHDCLMFCAGAAEAVNGIDLAAEHRGKYGTKEEAARYLRGLGFRKPATLIASLLTEKPIVRAQRGDILLGPDGIPGVCIGADVLFVGMSEGVDGYVRLPRRACVKAWAS